MEKYYVFLISLLIVFDSCQGHGNSLPDQSRRNAIPPVSVTPGDTVKGPGKSVWYIFQSKDHSYWFGSDGDGVYHYDGKHTIQFTTKHGLCNNRVRGIQEDSSGNVFITTIGGISRFDGKVFFTLPVTESSASVSGWGLRPNDLWFQGSQDSGVLYRYDGKSLYRLKFPKTRMGEDFIATYPRSAYPAMAFNPYDVYTIYKDSKGNMWFGTGNLGACRYDGASFDWISGDDLAESGDGPSNGVRSIIEDKDGNFRFSNTQYRYRIYGNDAREKQKNAFQYSREKGIGSLDGKKDGTLCDYLSATKDTLGNLWIVTYNAGVWQYDGKKISHYPVTENGKAITLFCVYTDRLGALWLGTHEAGAYRFNGNSFEQFKP